MAIELSAFAGRKLSGQESMLKAVKREATFFDGAEPRLVYIAKKLKEALKLEEVLTEAGFDYGVEPDRYRGGFIFRTERIGAFFYVRPESEAAVRQFLLDRGYKLPPEEPTPQIEE